MEKGLEPNLQKDAPSVQKFRNIWAPLQMRMRMTANREIWKRKVNLLLVELVELKEKGKDLKRRRKKV